MVEIVSSDNRRIAIRLENGEMTNIFYQTLYDAFSNIRGFNVQRNLGNLSFTSNLANLLLYVPVPNQPQGRAFLSIKPEGDIISFSSVSRPFGYSLRNVDTQEVTLDIPQSRERTTIRNPQYYGFENASQINLLPMFNFSSQLMRWVLSSRDIRGEYYNNISRTHPYFSYRSFEASMKDLGNLLSGLFERRH